MQHRDPRKNPESAAGQTVTNRVPRKKKSYSSRSKLPSNEQNDERDDGSDESTDCRILCPFVSADHNDRTRNSRRPFSSVDVHDKSRQLTLANYAPIRACSVVYAQNLLGRAKTCRHDDAHRTHRKQSKRQKPIYHHRRDSAYHRRRYSTFASRHGNQKLIFFGPEMEKRVRPRPLDNLRKIHATRRTPSYTRYEYVIRTVEFLTDFLRDEFSIKIIANTGRLILWP